jgi:acetyl/propionyl-CoA carboxylase alpha subunit
VRVADEAYLLGGPSASDSYLSVDRIIDVVRRSGADAVHPGYGFLAENAGLAQSVVAAGAAWVGPPPDAIGTMGDKISSRAAAIKAGVAPVPGTDSAITDAGEVIEFGNAFGWPVAIKAAFGGGGRGMRVVSSAAGAAEALESAQREAEKSFGRPECYIEKYLPWPRHVEVQVFADSFGNTVHLGTRDCSVQRRHQKLVEEAPAPDLPASVVSEMGEAAVSVARGCGYQSAGTVEFIYQDGKFYFLEMNTRLQVEHPVTELVTGLDLVRLQIEIAAGNRLPFTQEQIALRGAAIECRIYAEDPANNFFPSPGRITQLTEPSGPGVRLDSGVYAGWNVPLDYDPMLAKLIVWSGTREHAIERMLRALGEYHIGGIKTNISLFRAILHDPAFRAGDLHTGYLDHLLRTPLDLNQPPHPEIAAIAALVASKRIPSSEIAVTTTGSPWLASGRKDLLR